MNHETYDKLFDLFPPVDARRWKQKIQADLKGADYATLINSTPEGIDIRPFYHRDEFRGLDADFSTPAFRIAAILDEGPQSGQIRFLVEHGAQRVHIFAPSHKQTPDALTEFRNILIWHPRGRDWDGVFAVAGKGFHVRIAPLGDLTRTGNWRSGEQTDLHHLHKLLEKHSSVTIEIDLAHLADAGANMVQQMAYGLAQAAWYAGKNFDISRFRPCLAVGTRYLTEIAKLRAFRYLWFRLFGQEPQLCVRPTLRNKTLRDPYMNMLRTGLEMMAAVMGGADEIINLPYDYLFARSDDSQRLAINQLLLLRHESSFARHAGAHRGSYFLEETAERLARKTAGLFEQIQAGGGYVQHLHKGILQRKIDQAAAKEQTAYDSGKHVLVGSNKYQVENETLPDPLPRAFVQRRREKTLLRPVIARRLAEAGEREILKNQRP